MPPALTRNARGDLRDPNTGASLPPRSQAEEVAATLRGDGRDAQIAVRFVEQVPEVLRHVDLAADDARAIPL